MPANKDFTRLVRRRMQKPGESYSAARAQLLSHRPPPASRSPAADSVTLAGRRKA
jgi:hypothetical protein